MAQPEFSSTEDQPLSWLDRQPPRRLQAYGAILVAGALAASAWAVGDYNFLGNGISAPSAPQPSVEHFEPNAPLPTDGLAYSLRLPQ